MKVYKLFGRITGTREECISCLKFFDSKEMLVCYERADDGCSRDHCHFIAQKEYKNMKNLREAFSYKCKQELGETLRYSIKEYEELKDAEAYICKGHKTDAAIKPDILINTYGIDVQESYERFHKTAYAYKEAKKTKCIWKELIAYIEDKEPDFFGDEFSEIYGSVLQVRIASYLYDYYLENDRMIQGKYFQQMIITTVIAHKKKSKAIKRCIIESWTDDISYWNGMDQHYYAGVQEAFDNI